METARQFNLEFRVTDGAASPYLALGAVVFAGADISSSGLSEHQRGAEASPPIAATSPQAKQSDKNAACAWSYVMATGPGGAAIATH